MSKEKSELKIDVLIPEIVLNENPEIKNIYDIETQTISYEIENSIPETFSKELKSLVPEFNGKDIVVFNPLVEAVNKLQEIKTLVCNLEDMDASERVYIDNNKLIGSFNTSLKEAKKTMKDPHISFNKKVDSIFSLFENESKNTRSALESNFKPLLDKREKEKQEKIDAQKEKELKAIAELSETNNDLNNKLNQQIKDTASAEIRNAISSILSSAAIKIPTLNLEGLEVMKSNLENIKFNMYVSFELEKPFSHEELADFRSVFNQNKHAAVRNVELTIESIKNKEKLALQEVAQEAQAPTPPQPEPLQQTGASYTDAELFQFITDANKNILLNYKLMMERAQNTKFKNPDVQGLADKLTTEQFPKIVDWLEKLSNYCDKKQLIINENYNN